MSDLVTLAALDADGAIQGRSDLDPQAVEEERRQDRQLRAHARVPRGRALQAGGHQQHGHEPDLRHFINVVGEHEAEHVKALRKALGSSAIKTPKFAFGDTVTNEAKLRQTAQVLEDTGVSAYAGQGPNPLQRPLVVAALSIHSVEARHAAWIRFLNYGGGGGTGGGNPANYPAPRAFDKAKSEKKVLGAVTATGFIKG